MSGLIERLRAAEKDIADHGGYDQHARTISDAIAAIGGEGETITVGDRTYRKFIRYPEEVTDGTLRCISCGQIDEEEYHDEALCPACRSEEGAGENCRISHDEIKEMFGENMPFAAAKILFPEKSEPLTLDELRFVLRSIAAWNHRSGEGAGVSEALAYAERLAIALHAKHYASDAPQWKSLSGDLIGILTQIDNMTSGLSRSALTATQSAPIAWACLCETDAVIDGAFGSKEEAETHRKKIGADCVIPLYRHPATHPAPAPGVSEASVKPLEWRYFAAAFPTAWDSETPFGRYSVEERWSPNVEPPDWHQDADSKWALSFGVQLVGVYDSLAQAKAAAQADFDKRILSCLTATQSAPAPGGWREALNEAPKDGTMVRLLVRPLEGEGWTPFADSWDPYETIGFNNLANTGEDEWQFAGWDWSHDCFTDGRGVVIGWAPLCASPAPEPVADAVAEDCWRELVEKTDRTSPEEYPNMALITRHELAGFIGRAPRAGTTAEEAGWVIERGDSDTSAPTYWTGHDMWSQDHMDAVRFARKVDGEKAAAREQRWHGLAHRVCEHMWMAALAQPAPAAQEAPSGVVEAWRIAEDALASISGERTPQRFPETSYDLAARALNEARAALAERQPQPQEGREKLPQWWRPSPKLKLALEHYRGVKADFEEFDGDRRGIGAALSERAFGVLQAIADDHLEDDDGDQNYHLVRLVIGLIDRLTAAPLPSQEGE